MAGRKLILVLAAGAAAGLLVMAAAWTLLRASDERANDRPIAGLDKARIVVVKPGSSLAGVASMLAGEGLHPSAKGVRVYFSGKERKIVDGPFTEAKELIAGFWLWQVRSMEEAVEWVKRSPFQ